MDEAIETLASPDVTVTNQSDKELQLYKLRELDSLVREAVAECEVPPRLENLDSSASWEGIKSMLI